MGSPFLTEDKRAYQWPPLPARSEQVFKRVTNVINDGGPQHWMKPWVAKEISEHVADNWYELGWYFLNGERDRGVKMLKSIPDNKRDTAAVRGTDIHYWLEHISLGNQVEIPEPLVAHVDQGIDFLRTIQPEFLMTEGTIFNATHGYAGSFDAIIRVTRHAGTEHLFTGEFANRSELFVLIDYKTGDKGAKDTYALQLAMYRNGEWLAYQNPDGSWFKAQMPPIDLCCVLEVNADKWRLLEMRTDDEVWESAKHFCGVARWTKDVAKTVMTGTREIRPTVVADEGFGEVPLVGDNAGVGGASPAPALYEQVLHGALSVEDSVAKLSRAFNV